MPEPAIVLRDVTKSYDAIVAVDNLSLTVPRGSIYGFIGPNGGYRSDELHLRVLGREPSARQCCAHRRREVKSTLGIGEVRYV